MQTIETKYIPPSNVLGARIRVFTKLAKPLSKTFTVGYLDQFISDRNINPASHIQAVKEFMKFHKLDWHGAWYYGDTKTGYVFVYADDVVLL